MSPKTPEEWQEYYAKHRDKINANRKKNRLAKEEAEKLRLMNPLNLDNKPVREAGEQEYAQAGGMFVAQNRGGDEPPVVQSGISEQSTIVPFPGKRDCTTQAGSAGGTNIVQSEPDTQAEMLCVLHKISAQLDSQEIVQSERGENCTIGPLHNCADTANPKFSGDAKLCNPNFDGRDRAEIDTARRPLLTYAIAMFIAVFLGFNTFFLVSEQVSLYTSLGYSGMLATLIAVLTESALVSFSLMASWAKDYFWKFLLYAGCSVTAVIVIGVLDSSVKNRAAEKIRNSEQAEMLKKQILSLEAMEATALGIITSIDAKVYPTRVNRLMGQLNSPVSEHGYTYQLGQLRKQLAEVSVDTESVQQEIWVMKWQRWGAMLWNILMAAFLGFLLAGQKRKSLAKQGFESWRNYISRPCEA